MRSPAARRGVALAAILAGYGGVLLLSARLGPTARHLLPNLWLLAGSVLLLRQAGPALQLTRGGRRTGPWAVVLLALALGVGGMGLGALGVSPRAAALDWVQALALLGWVPLAEELFFRGLVLDTLRRVGPTLATLATSALFGLLHLPQGTAIPMFAISLALCLATLRTGSLLWAVGAHVGWNALAVLWRVEEGPERVGLGIMVATALAALAAWGHVRRDHAAPDARPATSAG